MIAATGEPMVIPRGYPFRVQGVRLRTSSRTVYETDSLMLRIGDGGDDAIVEVAMELDDTDADDPSWYVDITAEQTALLVARVYRYALVDDDGFVVLAGAVHMVAHPL